MPPAVGPRLTKSMAEGRRDLLPLGATLEVLVLRPVAPNVELLSWVAINAEGRPIVVVRLFCCGTRVSLVWPPKLTGMNEGINDLLPWRTGAGVS